MNGYYIDRKKVHKVMKQNNMKTQLQLAEKIGITPNRLSVILSSETNPFKKNIQLLCNALDVTPFDIISDGVYKHSIKKQKDLLKKEKHMDYEDEFVDVDSITAFRPYNALELFAGAGGLALGLENAGFNTVGLVDNDKYATETLRINRPNWNVIEDDIINVAENDIYNFIDRNIDVDLVSGGYPCQAFSYAGQRRGLEDARGTMFFHFAKIIEQIMPKVFLAENVRGLLNHDKGKTLKTMLKTFRDIGYNVEHHVLKANDYNVAQKRVRVIIVGIRNDFDIKYKLPKPFDYKPVLKDILQNVPPSLGAKYPDKKRSVLDLVPPGGCWRDLPEDIARDYMGKSYYSSGGRTGMARRLSWDEPSLTLTCSPAQKQTERCHPDETRPFTVREYAKIQSFPDEWEFYGSMNQQYKQIGNAVPVELGRVIGLSIIDVLNRL